MHSEEGRVLHFCLENCIARVSTIHIWNKIVHQQKIVHQSPGRSSQYSSPTQNAHAQRKVLQRGTVTLNILKACIADRKKFFL